MADIMNLFTKRRAVGVAVAASIVVGGSLPYLKADEGYREFPYIDIANHPTDCFGETEGVVMGVARGREKCEALLRSRVFKDYYTPLTQGINSFVYLPAATQMATLRLSYNIGVKATVSGSVGRLLTAGHIKEACDAFMLYNKARVQGKLTEVKGLTLRRSRERAQCLEGA